MFISDNGGEHVNELTMRTMAEKGVKVVLSTPENQNQDPTERHIGIINKLICQNASSGTNGHPVVVLCVHIRNQCAEFVARHCRGVQA
jgi:hypothetical protein